MSNVIYYFTGTGNSLAFARKITKELGDTKLLNIRHNQNELDATQYERVGIIFPVYYYKMPAFVESFIRKLTLSPKQYIFGVATYGGMRGISLVDLRELLQEKGCSLKGEFSVFMPGNYIVEYGAFPDFFNNLLVSKAEKTAKRISNIIKMKQPSKPAGPRTFEKLYLSRSGSKQFIIEKRTGFGNMDSGFNSDTNCNGCRACEKVCPVNNVSIENGHPVWEHRCEQCMACIQWCSRKSIHYLDKTQKRKFYHHRDISIKDILSLEEFIKHL
ncbi:MAG: 4Fe-4S ferredoxin [Eubacterium sp.]|jgi:ferredoxin|nr:4Fe-4S ferredoxin [Eubacterium sp.]